MCARNAIRSIRHWGDRCGLWISLNRAAPIVRLTGRRDALELARLQYIPDINPMAGFTGSIEQMIGLGLSIPTFLPRLEGMVKEARAE